MITNLVLVEAFLVMVAETHSNQQTQSRERQHDRNAIPSSVAAGFLCISACLGSTSTGPAANMPSQF